MGNKAIGYDNVDISIEITKDGNKMLLSEYEVGQIVCQWYTNGMIEDILQNDDGRDLEEFFDLSEVGLGIKTIKTEIK